MKAVTAHGRLAVRQNRDILPIEVEVDGVDIWPAYAVAFAELSGMLEGAVDDADLDAAIQHGKSLLEAEVISRAMLDREANRVIDLVVKWGERHARAAANN